MTTAPPHPCVCSLRRSVCDRSCTGTAGGPPLYVVGLRLGGRRCVVAGGGPVALEKVNGLLVCGGDVTLVAPEVVPGIDALVRENRIGCRRRRYEPGDAAGALVAIAATDDFDLNLRIYTDASRAGALVNVVNAPLLCDFVLPAVVRAPPVTVAISTTGASPALARRLKREIGERYARGLPGSRDRSR